MGISEEFRQIGYDIIGSAFDVRNSTGRGLRENYYTSALIWELKEKGYTVEKEVLVPAMYKGMEIADSYKADIVVNGSVIIEAKAVTKMCEEEVRQLLTYMKLSAFKLGYLINFGALNFGIGKVSDPFPYCKGIYRIVNGIEDPQ